MTAEKPYAVEDDIITCERGHPLYRLVSDVFKGAPLRAVEVERLDPRVEIPMRRSIIRGVCHCGARWIGAPRDGEIGVNRIHFEEGWRP